MDNAFEELMKEVGDCGCYQYLLVPMALTNIITAVWSMLHMVFGSFEPDWWCVSRDILRNSSRDQFLDRSISQGVDLNVSEIIWSKGGVWNETDISNQLMANRSFKVCAAHSDQNGGCERIVFASGMNTVVSQFQLVCDLAWVPSLIISVQMIGVLIGASVTGQLADSIGRKKTLLSINVLHAAFNFIGAFSVNWQMFTVMRAIIGLTAGGILVSSYAYPVEFVGIKWRALVGSIPVWGVGCLTFSLLVWALKDWYHVHLATAGCTAAFLLNWIFLPESFRWLSTRGRTIHAQHVLHQIARWNGRKVPDVDTVRRANAGITQQRCHYLHIFSTWIMVKTSVLNGFMWFTCSLVYYGISFGIKDMSGNFFLNFFLMSLTEIPSTILVYPLGGCIGRRWTCFSGCFVASLGCLSVVPVTLLVSDEESGKYVNGLCLVAKMGLSLGWCAMTVFICELYPTVVRNIGCGFCNTLARLGGIIAPFLLSTGDSYIFYVVIGIAMGLSAVVNLLLPETGGQPLEDSLRMSSKGAASALAADDEMQLQRLS